MLKGGSGGGGGGGVVKGRQGSWADKTLFRLLDQNKATVNLIFLTSAQSRFWCGRKGGGPKSGC